ncbi:MAG: hypothetical protein ABIG84_05130 [archaeon]
MIKEKWDDKYDVKTVSAKLNQLDFVKFKIHCDTKGITPSKEIKNLIAHEINDPIAQNVAGKSVFVYNPAKDNFGWKAVLDKEIISYIEDDLSFEFLKQLKDAIDVAIDERNTFIQKTNNDSVSIPGKILRKGL